MLLAKKLEPASTAAVGSPDLSCDNNLASGKRTMVVTVRNESARLSVAQADLILRVPIPDPFVYETGTTTIDGVSVSDLPPGTLPSTFPM